MFWNNFVLLCNSKNKTPTSVISELNISRGSVTHWKSGKVPHHNTLIKIADYFDVPVDNLLRKPQKPTITQIAKVEPPEADIENIKPIESFQMSIVPVDSPLYRQVTEHEGKVLDAYRAQAEMQPAVDKLLGVPAEEETVTLYSAAYSKDNTPEEIITISKAEWERLKSLPFTDQDL